MKQKHTLISFLVLVAFKTRLLLSLRYKVSIKGRQVLKDATPVLILPNHQALVDPMILVSHVYRYSHAIPLVSSSFYDLPLLKTGFKILGAIRVSNLEAGSRNIHVLNQITQSALEGFEKGNSVVLYPSGQLANQGYEKIINKKSAHKIVSEMPDGVKVVGVRITGLWGSMWSKARTGKTPHFFLLVLKSLAYLLANFIFFLPRRSVLLEIVDLTTEAKSKAREGIKDFNRYLEDFYNQHGEEQANFVRHFFFLRSHH